MSITLVVKKQRKRIFQWVCKSGMSVFVMWQFKKIFFKLLQGFDLVAPLFLVELPPALAEGDIGCVCIGFTKYPFFYLKGYCDFKTPLR